MQYQENRVLLTTLNLEFDENPILKSIEDNIPEEEELYFYYPDHLGSASLITDHNGNPVQYLQYASYGEITLDQHSFDYQERFKFDTGGVAKLRGMELQMRVFTPFAVVFTGKELDKETGYFFFGARNLESYYITGFTSVDPLADKNIAESPYVYCSGRPTNKIDPTGEDDIEIQWNPEKGTFNVNRIKNKNYDQIHIIGEDGERIVSSEQYSYGTIGREKWGMYHGKKNYTFRISGDDNAARVFEFLGSNFTKAKGLPLEWSRVQIGTSGGEQNIIGTSMQPASTSIGLYILDSGYTIRGVDHNHPSGIGRPSGNDLMAAQRYNAAFPDATLRIFTPGSYTIYNRLGILYSSLPDIIVEGVLKK